MTNFIEVEIFYVWGIDFMGSFPSSYWAQVHTFGSGLLMSLQNHSLQTRDLARFGIAFIYIYGRVLITFLIFSFIWFL